MVDIAGPSLGAENLNEYDREILEELGPEALERFNSLAISRMIGELEDREALQGEEQFGVVVLHGTDPLSDLARSLEYPKFKKAFKNTYEEMEEGYGPYDERSVFILIVDKIERKPAGALRLILPPQAEGDQPQISLRDVASPEHGWNTDFVGAINGYLATRTDLPAEYRQTSMENIIDAGTVAVGPGYGGGKQPTPGEEAKSGLVSAALYRSAALYTLNAHVNDPNAPRDWVTVMDEHPLSIIQPVFDNPLTHIPGLDAKRYWGSKLSTPLYMNIAEYFGRMKATNPGMYAFLRDARGDVDIQQFFTFPEELQPPENY